MVHFDNPDSETRGTFATLRDVGGGVTVLAWRVIRLPVYLVLVTCEPVVRIGLTTIAVLGILASIVLEFSGAAPHFPFWGALLFFASCGALPWLYRAAVRLFAP
jgi:hypothetical protein